MVKLKALLGSDARTILMRKNILFSFLIKGWTGVVLLLLIPITLKCLDVYQNGIWLTISSMLIWLDNMDIGLGNGLRNGLASSIAHEDFRKARIYVSNTFLMLIFIMIPSLLLLISFVSYSDIYSLLNVDADIVPNLNKVLIISLIFVCATFIFKFIGNVYLGLQLPAVSNFLTCIGYTLVLAGTYFLYYSDNGSLLTIAIVNTASPLVVYLLCYPYTFFIKYPHLRPKLRDLDLKIAKELFSVGIKFFLLQMTSSLVFMSSSFLMSRLFSPKEVTPYQITYRYFSIILHFFTVICNPLWSATTDAFERKEYDWIRHSARKTNKIIVICFLLILAFTLISKPVYGIWVGRDVYIPWAYTIGMAIYMAITLYSLAFCYFLNGMRLLNLQLVCTIGGGCIFFVLTFALSHYYNNAFVILIALCISNIPSMICNKIQFERNIGNTAKGIWRK